MKLLAYIVNESQPDSASARKAEIVVGGPNKETLMTDPEPDDAITEIANLLATAYLRLRAQDGPKGLDSPETGSAHVTAG